MNIFSLLATVIESKWQLLISYKLSFLINKKIYGKQFALYNAKMS